MNVKKIFSSVLAADFSVLREEIKAVETAGVDSIHVDVMDGLFTSNISVGLPIVRAISKSTMLPVDVHLMIEAPDRYIIDFISAGAGYISVHQEACKHLHRTVQLIKDGGAKAGIAINPSTSLEQVRWVLREVDFILIMSVNPGFGGQKFIRNILKKIYELRCIISDMDLNVSIQVDGGVNIRTINDISKAGADIFVVGSAIFSSIDYTKTVNDLKAKV